MTGRGRVERSVSTWQQPVPPTWGPVRADLIARVAARVASLGAERRRVAVDGLTAAGKTSFGHELAVVLADEGQVVLRASLDDFKRPWSEAHLYDRLTAEGYYRNAFDIDAIHQRLLGPAGPGGSGEVTLCSIDPITQIDHSSTTVAMPDDGVLIVDGMFALRPELVEHWDLRIGLSIDPELSIRRGVDRDATAEGGREQAEALHRERYLAADMIYIAEVDPRARADVVIDNSDFNSPALVRY